MALTQLSIRRGNVPTPVNATPGGSLFTNGGPSSVYYGPTSSVASGDGTEITSGGTATLTGTQYLVLASTGTLAKVSVVPTYTGDEEDALVATQLQVTGNTAVGGTLAVTGAQTLTGATAMAGAVTMTKASGTGLAVTSNATVGGTIAVTGASTLTGAVSAAKPTGTGLAVTADGTVGGTLGVTGAATLGSAVVTAGATVGTTLAVTGVTTATGGIAGGRKRNPVFPSANSLTFGTDTTPTSGTVYYGELWVPANATLTGIAYLIGSVGGTDNVIVALYSAAGVMLRSSALAGTLVGSTATYQEVPFTSTYAAVGPAQYFVSVSFNGNTARFRTVAAGGSLPTGSAAGVFGTLDAITPPTTFTADKAPIANSY